MRGAVRARGCVKNWKFVMQLLKKIKSLFTQALSSNSSPAKLATSFAVGLFIAFSPLPGAHTAIMFFCGWFFRLNIPMLSVATFLNNPWTMIPFFVVDYSIGYWIVHSLFGVNVTWFISLEKLFGSGKICLVSFLVGGFFLGALAALISYPIMLRFFRKVKAKPS